MHQKSARRPAIGNKKNSLMLKLFVIGFLALLLLVPSFMIQSIISERQSLHEQAITEVSDKWANQQMLSGPILSIPVVFKEKRNLDTHSNNLSSGKSSQYEWIEFTQYYHILPDLLDIKGNIHPQQLKRGIYDIVVYESYLEMSGKMTISEESLSFDNVSKILWEEAILTVGISDLRGIQERIDLKLNGQILPPRPGSPIGNIIPQGIHFKLDGQELTYETPLTFEVNMSLQGSRNMSFSPMGKETKVHLQSDWQTPSFIGAFLPDMRNINENGFEASWKVLELNRGIRQAWLGNEFALHIEETAFGLDLLMPLDDYQKSMRSAKYAIMTIALTFLIFFLVEVKHGSRIHPLQYTLVGLALCLFYVLLVSLSEHISFNLAYGISTFGIVTMISVYSLTLFKTVNMSSLLLIMLSAIYGFLFVTLQLAEFALLMGSIGLFVILGLTMYFTRNIDWYQSNSKEKA